VKPQIKSDFGDDDFKQPSNAPSNKISLSTSGNQQPSFNRPTSPPINNQRMQNGNSASYAKQNIPSDNDSYMDYDTTSNVSDTNVVNSKKVVKYGDNEDEFFYEEDEDGLDKEISGMAPVPVPKSSLNKTSYTSYNENVSMFKPSFNNNSSRLTGSSDFSPENDYQPNNNRTFSNNTNYSTTNNYQKPTNNYQTPSRK
jgi:hypothetical protein